MGTIVNIFAILGGAAIGVLLGNRLPEHMSRTLTDAMGLVVLVLFTIGPMAVLGALQDGLGQGFDILALKSTLDGFTAIAFAAALGWGVAFSAIPVGLWQGLLTVVAIGAGTLMPDSVGASITATGGILLLGTGLRLLQIRMVSVADLLPALIFAPLITLAVDALI